MGNKNIQKKIYIFNSVMIMVVMMMMMVVMMIMMMMMMMKMMIGTEGVMVVGITRS